MSNYPTKIGTKVLDLFECWDEEEKGGNFVWNYSDWRRARQWSGFHIWSSQASNSSKLSENTVQHSATHCKLLTLQIIWKHSAALHHPPQCKLRSALFKTALLNIIKYHSITVSALVPRYHSISISINIAVSQYHRLHCTQPLRHSKGAIWAQRTGFNFCWLPLTNSYQIPLLQALTTKVSKILPNPLCVPTTTKTTSSSSANKRDTILEIRSTSPSMNNGCEE